MITSSSSLTEIQPEAHGIWRYQRYFSPIIEPNYQNSLDEGLTPLSDFPEIAKQIGASSFYLKREDLNPTGSQKDRCAAFQTSWALQSGNRIVTISSSGNAAISTAAYCARAGIHLIANISKNTEPQKISRMRDFGATVVISDDPIKYARYLEKMFGIVNLRPSTNPMATEGYKSIGFEIIESGIPVNAIFLYASSASTLVGVSEALEEHKKNRPDYKIPQIHAVQAGLVNSLALSWGINCDLSDRSVVGDLGVKNTKRTEQAIEHLRSTSGSVWYVQNEEIVEANKRLNTLGIDTSFEGAAAFAGVLQAKHRLQHNNVVCLITGRSYPSSENNGIVFASNYEDLKLIVSGLKES